MFILIYLLKNIKQKIKNKNIFLKLQGITNNGDFIEFPVIKYQI